MQIEILLILFDPHFLVQYLPGAQQLEPDIFDLRIASSLLIGWEDVQLNYASSLPQLF